MSTRIRRYLKTKNGDLIYIPKNKSGKSDGTFEYNGVIYEPNSWKILKEIRTTTTKIRWEDE